MTTAMSFSLQHFIKFIPKYLLVTVNLTDSVLLTVSVRISHFHKAVKPKPQRCVNLQTLSAQRSSKQQTNRVTLTDYNGPQERDAGKPSGFIAKQKQDFPVSGS